MSDPRKGTKDLGETHLFGSKVDGVLIITVLPHVTAPSVSLSLRHLSSGTKLRDFGCRSRGSCVCVRPVEEESPGVTEEEEPSTEEPQCVTLSGQMSERTTGTPHLCRSENGSCGPTESPHSPTLELKHPDIVGERSVYFRVLEEGWKEGRRAGLRQWEYRDISEVSSPLSFRLTR